MAVTGIEKDINLPGPMGRERGTLLSAMQPIPPDELVARNVTRGWFGVEWLPWGTGNISVDAIDCDVVYDFSARELPDLLVQPAFLMWDALKCSTLSSESEWLRGRVVDNLNVYASAAFAAELSTGTASGGLAISGDATYTPTIISATAVDVGRGIAELEDHLADVLHGAIGMIHLTPGLLALAVGDGYVEWRDGQYRTPSGHVVVGDAGFDGTATPFGSTAATSTQAWIYATSMVWYAISGINTTDILTDDQHDTDILHNLNRPIAKRYGLLTWDPSATGAIKVTFAASEGGATTPLTIWGYAPAVGAIAAAEAFQGVSLYNSHATDAVLIYVRYGNGGASTPYAPIAIAAGESVNWFLDPSAGIPVGASGVYVTDESVGAAAITDLVGVIYTGAA